MDSLAFLLRRHEHAPLGSARECYERLESLGGDGTTIERAAMGGAVVDRLGYAFLAGYRAALARLDPALATARACLAATEEGGAHPKAIRTRLEGDVLTGKKTFVTLASHAEKLLVITSVGESEGRNRLRAVVIPSDRSGVTIRARPPLPFAPEIPHCEVVLDAVRVLPGETLEGDAYERVLKPFRTIEDAHVMAAVLGHLVALSQSEGHKEQMLATLSCLRDIGARDALDPVTHLALSGAVASAVGLATAMDWSGADAETRERWERDKPLLQVARAAREQRRQAAWTRLQE